MPNTPDVDALVGEMTLDEKLAQLGGVWVTDLLDERGFDREAARRAMRHGIGHVTRIGATTGLRPAERAALMNEIQRFALEETRLGIPVIVHEESTGGYCARDATVFPQAIGLAATWDEQLVGEVADVIRQQLVAVGARQALAPVLDVARDPRWGRVEETYGEDPYLAGRVGTAYVRALQAGLRDGVLATGKHFLGYGLSEGGMNWAPVQLGPRELREVYAEPFAAAIRDAGLGSVMNSYASVDGIPCAGGASILTALLREELGFDGVVVADYFAVVQLMTHHHVAASREDAAAIAITAGLDLELPATDCYGEPLQARVEDGTVPMDVVDRAVRRVLASKARLGLFEQPYVDATAATAVFDTPAQRAVARRAAASSLVLLTNDGVLPLAPDVGSLAVIGPSADDPRLLQGDYHYPAHVEIVYEGAASALVPASDEQGSLQAGPYFTHHVTPLAALRDVYGDRVAYERGCAVTGDDADGIAAAASVAAGADVAIVFVGGESGLQPHSTVGEARDATSLALTGVQHELVDAVLATGTPTVVVVVSGRVHALADIAERASALVYAWLPGEEGGNAIADVLTGRIDASGRLPVSIPRTVGQVPVYRSPRAGGGRSMFYGDYTDCSRTPLFPLGHGLSYATFERGPLDIEREGSTTEPVVLSIETRNTSDRPGIDVVKLTVGDDVASVARPERALCGFAKVALGPGERRTVRFTVHPSRLAFYDPDMRFVVEPGSFTFRVGKASATVQLRGGVREYRQRDVVATAVELTAAR
ncbi:MAG TPA: glycoside hydrolase family 3 N-terminal domain-containing protein [Acidimicrobiia bacterium]|nr:glycoside hydrolase family 3 N-terminal domain-containing protein [Acidimicrobiia bacterium]